MLWYEDEKWILTNICFSFMVTLPHELISVTFCCCSNFILFPYCRKTAAKMHDAEYYT